jgi:hypothetical protein
MSLVYRAIAQPSASASTVGLAQTLGATTRAHMRKIILILKRAFKHPGVLVVVTALLSSYLLPALIKKSQDRVQAQQIRVQLAKQMSEGATKMILAIQFFEHFAGLQQEIYDQRYEEWEIQKVSISTQIRGFTSNAAVAKDWEKLANGINLVYELSGTHDSADRKGRIDRLKTHFSLPESDWIALTSENPRRADLAASNTYFAAWLRLREVMLGNLAESVSSILATPIRLDGESDA